MRKLLAYSLPLVLFLGFAVLPAFAGPAIPTPTEVTQPDGTVLQVQIRGDEYHNWTELQPTGRTIIKNSKTNFWEYAERSPDGTLRASGIRAEPGGRNAPDAMPSETKPQGNHQLEKPDGC